MKNLRKNQKNSIFLFVLLSISIIGLQVIPINAQESNLPNENSIPRGIRLTFPGDPRIEIAVSWYTLTETQTEIKMGLDENTLNAPTENFSVYVDTVYDTYIHHVVLTGLLPNTTYYYSVGSDEGGWSKVYNFTTAPADSGETLHFAVYGDNRSNRIMRRLVNRLVLQNSSYLYPDYPLRFIMNAGDLVSRGTEYERWNAYFMDGEMLHTQIPLLPIIGNHEIGWDGKSDSYYREQVVLPENGNDEWYWALRYQNAFILGLDSESHGIPVYDTQSIHWMNNMLALSENDSNVLWKFAIFHQPPFVSSSHNARDDLREIWSPIFENYNVDVVFNGHCHLYERSYPVAHNLTLDPQAYENTSDFISPKYPIYIVSGAAGMGGPIDATPERDTNYMAYQNHTWSYVDILIKNNLTSKTTKLIAKVIGVLPQYNSTGGIDEFNLNTTVLLDEFSITKPIPDTWKSTFNIQSPQASYLYDTVSDLHKMKAIALTITFIAIAGIVALNIVLIRKHLIYKKKILKK